MKVKSCILFLFILSACIFGQSSNMKEFASHLKKQVKKDGYSIIHDNFHDINSYRPMSSNTITFSSKKQYSIVVLVEKRTSVNIKLNIEGEEIEPKCYYDSKLNISVVMTSFKDVSGKGYIKASINDQLWHTGYFLIGVK